MAGINNPYWLMLSHLFHRIHFSSENKDYVYLQNRRFHRGLLSFDLSYTLINYTKINCRITLKICKCCAVTPLIQLFQ